MTMKRVAMILALFGTVCYVGAVVGASFLSVVKSYTAVGY